MRKWVRNILFLCKLPHMRRLYEQIETLNGLVAKQGEFPAGHYYSPIPDQADVSRCLERNANTACVGIELNAKAQACLLKAFEPYYAELPFPEKPREGMRYYYDQGWFCYGDAIMLYCFIRHFKPKRIIEIGSGYSSAVMLDTLEHFPCSHESVTLIEPFPKRLFSLLKPEDREKVKVIEHPVQDVDIEVFQSLGEGDLLFVDSSHVMKCGSDLQRVLFDILPILPVGIYVHFHDLFYPFEYPEAWLNGGRYWNEGYLLRAFLSNNRDWEIVLFNDYVGLKMADYMKASMPLCAKNFGASLYLRRVA